MGAIVSRSMSSTALFWALHQAVLIRDTTRFSERIPEERS